MAKYEISYRRPDRAHGVHQLEAKSDAEARIRFLNLDWVAFSDIEILKIEPALIGDYTQGGRLEDRPYNPYSVRRPSDEAAKYAAALVRQVTTGKGIDVPARAPSADWRKECDRLTTKIEKLAEAAQKCARAGKHELARAKRAEAKKLADERAAITKRNKGR